MRPSEAAPRASGPAIAVTASAAVPGSRTEAIDRPTDPPLAPDDNSALRHTGFTVSPVDVAGVASRSTAAVVQYAALIPPPSAAYSSSGRTLSSVAPDADWTGRGSAHERPVLSQVVRTRSSSGRSAAERSALGPAYGR